MLAVRPRNLSRGSRCLTLVAAVALGGFAACSDSGEAIDPDEDEEIIDDAILTLDDLPDGFEEAEPDDDDDPASESIEDCADDAGLDPDDIEENRVVESESIEFTLPSDDIFLSVVASIGSVRDTDPSERLLALFDDDDFQDCMFDALEESFADQGQDVSDFDAEVIDAAADGDASAALRVEAEVSGFDTEIEQHLVLVGRFGVSVQVVSLNAPIDGDLVEDALDAMIERIEDATA